MQKSVALIYLTEAREAGNDLSGLQYVNQMKMTVSQLRAGYLNLNTGLYVDVLQVDHDDILEEDETFKDATKVKEL